MTSYGKNLNIQIYGGSHDSEIGLTVENLPRGIAIDYESLLGFMQRRAPGQNRFSTGRREPDRPLFLSGIDENMVTNGEVLRAVIRNENMRSGDYADLTNIPRPSHADYPAIVKSRGRVDLRGGGHFSGRLTALMCVIGGILKDELAGRGIYIGAHIQSIHGVCDDRFDPVTVSRDDLEAVLSHDFPVINEEAGDLMKEQIDSAKAELDSVGGVVECAVLGLPVGIGEHIFCGMESRIAQAVFSIPAVKGVEFGAGFATAGLFGSENNDPYYTDGTEVKTKTNNAGGICGGMTTGMPLIFRGAIKPTPSIGKEQDSVNLSTMENVKLTVGGRHDPCIVQRAVPVFEAVAAIAVYDALLDCTSPEEMEK
ncbi:MAG: chorismate synthase [Ruminococcaceae bacterium]|nr:chorismate synthase [Oscillospiraceae bacterium]